MDIHEQKINTSAPDTPNEPKSILLVDDEVPVTKILDLQLQHLGYSVSAHLSASDALDEFKKSPDSFDLVITDMSMPEMTGCCMARALKEIRPDIPVILCTGFDEIPDHDDRDVSIADFLMKPVSRDDLSRSVQKALN